MGLLLITDEITFTLNNEGEWEDLDFDQERINQETLISLIDKLVESGKIIIGERTEGVLDVINGSFIKGTYKYCESIGEDWNDDKWIEDVQFETTTEELGIGSQLSDWWK